MRLFRCDGPAPAAPAVSQPEPAAHFLTPPPAARPIIEPTAPERYRVQFTVGKDTHDKLRRLQALLRREIPNGDPGAIFDRAVTLLLEKVEKAKLGATTKPRPIRPGTDKSHSRHVPNQSRRVAWRRDGGQCAFVGTRRKAVHRARVHRVPPRRGPRAGGTGHAREHRPTVSAPQPIRGGEGLRPS